MFYTNDYNQKKLFVKYLKMSNISSIIFFHNLFFWLLFRIYHFFNSIDISYRICILFTLNYIKKQKLKIIHIIMATTIDRHHVQNPAFNNIKLAGSEPLSVYIKMALTWLLQKITLGLVWLGKFLFRWTIGLLADICFVWFPEFVYHAYKLYGQIVLALTFGVILSILGICIYCCPD